MKKAFGWTVNCTLIIALAFVFTFILSTRDIELVKGVSNDEKKIPVIALHTERLSVSNSDIIDVITAQGGNIENFRCTLPSRFSEESHGIVTWSVQGDRDKVMERFHSELKKWEFMSLIRLENLLRTKSFRRKLLEAEYKQSLDEMRKGWPVTFTAEETLSRIESQRRYARKHNLPVEPIKSAATEGIRSTLNEMIRDFETGGILEYFTARESLLPFERIEEGTRLADEFGLDKKPLLDAARDFLERDFPDALKEIEKGDKRIERYARRISETISDPDTPRMLEAAMQKCMEARTKEIAPGIIRKDYGVEPGIIKDGEFLPYDSQEYNDSGSYQNVLRWSLLLDTSLEEVSVKVVDVMETKGSGGIWEKTEFPKEKTLKLDEGWVSDMLYVGSSSFEGDHLWYFEIYVEDSVEPALFQFVSLGIAFRADRNQWTSQITE